MSIFQKIFGAAPASQAQAMQPNQPAVTNNPNNNPAPTGTYKSDKTEANGVVPEDGNKPAADVSPLDKFAKIWETTPAAKDSPNNEATALTPEKMMEAAGKVDFSKVIDQASLAKISAGGEEAVQALVAIINKTSQTVYGQSTVVAKKLVDQAVESARSDFETKLPGLVKQQSVKEGMLANNPAFKDPAVAPIVEALQQQFAQKYPNASSAELQKLAQEYFVGAAAVMSPQKQTTTSKAKGAEAIDWDAWVNTPESLE